MTSWIAQAIAVARVELRIQVVSSTWRLAVFISVALASAITAVNVQDFARREAEVESLITRRDDAAADGRLVVGGFQREAALRVIRLPAPHSPLIAGLDRQSPQYWDIGPEGLTAGTTMAGEPTMAVSGDDIDLEFVLRVLIGLLCVVVGGRLMIVSRQGRMSKSLVSLPVHPTALSIGSLVGGGCAIGLAAAIVVTAAMATVAVTAPALATTAALQVGVALWAVTTIFGGALQGAAAIVVLTVRRTADSLAAAATVWLIGTLVAMAGVGAFARGLAPVTTRALFEAHRDAVYTSRIAQIALGAGDLVSRHLGPAINPGALRIEGALSDVVTAYWNGELLALRRQLEDLEHQFAATRIHQARLACWLGVAFPGTLLRQAALDVAGVGAGAERRSIAAARDYQAGLNTALFDTRPRVHVHFRSGVGHIVSFYDRAPRPAVSELPVFTAPTPSTFTQLADARWAVALLGLQWMLTWLIAIVTFVRSQASLGDWR